MERKEKEPVDCFVRTRCSRAGPKKPVPSSAAEAEVAVRSRWLCKSPPFEHPVKYSANAEALDGTGLKTVLRTAPP